MSEPTWTERLSRPFQADQIAAKPRLWCSACRSAQGKVCKAHHLVSCPNCKQRISNAHVDLDYVGHADVTARLNEVDPAWDWHPAYRDVDKEVLLAAIATGNAEIVDAVITNAPPLLDKQGGMWMTLELHDDEGKVVSRLGYGDSAGKTGPDATKELIGDGIRNASMRFGVALGLWSKSDRARAEVEAAAGDGKLAGKGRANPSESAGYSPGPEAETDNDILGDVQKLAQIAQELTEAKASPEALRERVYEPARKQRWLRKECLDPVSGERVQLSAVIQAAKAALEKHGGDDEAHGESADRDGAPRAAGVPGR